MTIKTIDIIDTPGGLFVGVKFPKIGEAVELTNDEAVEALEDLARILGYTLVDREERKSLLALTEEVDEDDNDYDLASTAWVIWQDRCEALAAAVNQTLAAETED